MKKHLKQPIPPPYQKWFDENNETVLQRRTLQNHFVFVIPKQSLSRVCPFGGTFVILQDSYEALFF